MISNVFLEAKKYFSYMIIMTTIKYMYIFVEVILGYQCTNILEYYFCHVICNDHLAATFHPETFLGLNQSSITKARHLIWFYLDCFVETINVDEVPLYYSASCNIQISNNTSHLLTVRSEWCDKFLKIFRVSITEVKLPIVESNTVFSHKKNFWNCLQSKTYIFQSNHMTC